MSDSYILFVSFQEEPTSPDHVHLLYMNMKLDDIADTIKDIQKPCPETADGGVDKRFSRLEETVEKLVSDLSEMKNKQTELKEEILENREYSIAKYHELRIETNDHVDVTNTKHRELKLSYDELKQHVDRNVKTTETTYVRWGRNVCPGNGTETIYAGYAGGSWYEHPGAAVSMLCLPQDPDWALYTDKEDVHSGFVYGTEYEPCNDRTDQFFGTGHFNRDVPCVVCNVKTRSSTIMVPGKTKCHPGWTLEYTGYLMSGYYKHVAASDYYCIDKDPENVVGGGEGRNDNGYLLYFVEARCGSLKCPPYVHGRELTCVVCSK